MNPRALDPEMCDASREKSTVSRYKNQVALHSADECLTISGYRETESHPETGFREPIFGKHLDN